MKRILITGKDSYIGSSFKKYLEQHSDDYYVEELDVREGTWKDYDFSTFDVVYHVAGIAHMKEVKENESLYYKVNRDLTVDIAKKAKESKVKHFIFMSSMSVYGLICLKELITKETTCHPNTYYGKSKYEAEQQLKKLEDNSFKVCIVRPPMVYGDGAPGNLGKLFSVVRKFHIFPTIRNERSSITVEKLCGYIKVYIDQNLYGLFLPQNNEYMCTYEMVKEKMKEENVKVVYFSIFNPVIKILIGKNGLITKCFGNLKYKKEG